MGEVGGVGEGSAAVVIKERLQGASGEDSTGLTSILSQWAWFSM